MELYKTIEGQCIRELTVERSRFIAVITHVESEQEALQFVAEKRAEFHDAKHNVFAFALSSGLSRYSDDGEPHGTAGKPILDVINGNGLCDVCVVVTRYFGGVLLGTGGLVRAYSSAARKAIEDACTVHMQPCAEYLITCGYADFEYVQKTVCRYGLVMSSDFGAEVSLCSAITLLSENDFLETMEKLFMGRYKIEKKGEKTLPLKNFL